MGETGKTEIRKISLEQFIIDHYQMFTVLGVFGGLTALFVRLENAAYLSFLSFVIFVFLNLDLWVKFPKSEKASLSLKVFEGLLQFLWILVAVYLIQAYPDYVAALMPTFFMFIFGGIFLYTFNKFKLFEPIRKITPPFRQRSTIIRMAIGMAIIITIILVSIFLGSLVGGLIKDYFKYPPTA
jgi:hypothetical protein